MVEGPAEGNIQIDEVLYLRRVVQRLTMRAEIAEEAADKFAALCDQLSTELNSLKEARKQIDLPEYKGEGHEH